MVKAAAGFGAAVVVVVGCSGSPKEIRAERDHAVARLLASGTTLEADQALIREIRRLLPGEEVPKSVLSLVSPDPRFPALARWHGRVGDWNVEALQTTNDSQAGCEPWGTITAASFSTRRSGAQQSYREWRKRLTAMLRVTPDGDVPERTRWLKNNRYPWYVSWYAGLEVDGDRLSIELSCEDDFSVSRGRRTRG